MLRRPFALLDDSLDGVTGAGEVFDNGKAGQGASAGVI
jgi:hypothetical protein